jgi:hypothetical protein
MTARVRTYTVTEANAMLPRLNLLFERQMALLAELDARSAALREAGGDPNDLTPNDGDDAALARRKDALREKLAEFKQGWTEIEATGAVVRDIRLGLVDFYGRRNGELVWLCWRYGEPAVAHWHPLDQGFASRRPLERTSIPPTLN